MSDSPTPYVGPPGPGALSLSLESELKTLNDTQTLLIEQLDLLTKSFSKNAGPGTGSGGSGASRSNFEGLTRAEKALNQKKAAKYEAKEKELQAQREKLQKAAKEASEEEKRQLEEKAKLVDDEIERNKQESELHERRVALIEKDEEYYSELSAAQRENRIFQEKIRRDQETNQKKEIQKWLRDQDFVKKMSGSQKDFTAASSQLLGKARKRLDIAAKEAEYKNQPARLMADRLLRDLEKVDESESANQDVFKELKSSFGFFGDLGSKAVGKLTGGPALSLDDRISESKRKQEAGKEVVQATKEELENFALEQEYDAKMLAATEAGRLEEAAFYKEAGDSFRQISQTLLDFTANYGTKPTIDSSAPLDISIQETAAAAAAEGTPAQPKVDYSEPKVKTQEQQIQAAMEGDNPNMKDGLVTKDGKMINLSPDDNVYAFKDGANGGAPKNEPGKKSPNESDLVKIGTAGMGFLFLGIKLDELLGDKEGEEEEPEPVQVKVESEDGSGGGGGGGAMPGGKNKKKGGSKKPKGAAGKGGGGFLTDLAEDISGMGQVIQKNPAAFALGLVGIVAIGLIMAGLLWVLSQIKGLDPTVVVAVGVLGLAVAGLAFTAMAIGVPAMTPVFWVGLGAITATVAVLLLAMVGLMEVGKNMTPQAAQGIATLASSILQFANPMMIMLIPAAAGIGALGLALAAFGAGQAAGGVLGAIGNFFGGDPVEKFKKFAEIGAPLKMAAEAIDLLVKSLMKMSALDMNKAADNVEKLGNAFSKSMIPSIMANSGGVSSKGASGSGTQTSPSIGVKDLYIAEDGTRIQKDPKDKMLFIQDLGTVEVIKSNQQTSGLTDNENDSGSLLHKNEMSPSETTMISLLGQILGELQQGNTIKKTTITPPANSLAGRNVLTRGA